MAEALSLPIIPETATDSRRIRRPRRRMIPAALALLLVAGPARPFTVGELYLLTNKAADDQPAILHIDPLTGDVDVLVGLTANVGGTFTYDPWRDRLIFMTSPDHRMKSVDDGGAMEDFVPGLVADGLIAARGDGLVYRWNTVLSGFQYIDRDDAVHDLLDEAGTGRFGFPDGTNLDELVFDPETNALVCFQGTYGGVNIDACADPNRPCAVRVPLTLSGTGVAGPPTAAQTDISASYVQIEGAGSAPGGVVWVVDSNTNDAEPRMQFLDTVEMVSGPFAWNGPYPGAATTNGGTYSSVRGQAIIVDTSNDVLRAFALGEHGDGTAFASGISGSLWNETTRLIEIGPALPDAVEDRPANAALFTDVRVSPNPCSGAATFSFAVRRDASASAAVYDAAGRLVRRLATDLRGDGPLAVVWDGRDDSGRDLASGTYLLQLKTAGGVTSVRVSLVR